MISFVIPAHNEERLLASTIRAIHRATSSLGGILYEIVVVDDSSIDRTADIATEENARVIPVDYRHIAATRDAGARASRGDILIFVDADTVIEARVIRAAIAAIEAVPSAVQRSGSSTVRCRFTRAHSPSRGPELLD